VINYTKGKRNCGLRKSSNAKDGEFIVSVLFLDFKLKFRQNSSINFTNTTRRILSSTAFAFCRFTYSTLSKSSCRFGSSSRFCTFAPFCFWYENRFCTKTVLVRKPFWYENRRTRQVRLERIYNLEVYDFIYFVTEMLN
jgi:hypothetical protein